MCFPSDAPDPPPPPAPPPPPPPVLEQAAPETAAPTDSESQNNQAVGVKKYKSRGLGIESNASSGTTSTGLGTTL